MIFMTGNAATDRAQHAVMRKMARDGARHTATDTADRMCRRVPSQPETHERKTCNQDTDLHRIQPPALLSER
jgi:hypothetical protein